jgi:glycosyltransferase involved in cell wall biosynthesis
VPGLRLTIVGEPRHVGEFDDIPQVTALGHVPRAQLQLMFERASLYAMPAVLEPWGLVYLEALSTKTPILGLRRHAIPELTAEGRFGFLVDRPEPDAVAEALVDALSDAARLQRMGTEGQRHCLANYTWDRVAESITATMAGAP